MKANCDQINKARFVKKKASVFSNSASFPESLLFQSPGARERDEKKRDSGNEAASNLGRH